MGGSKEVKEAWEDYWRRNRDNALFLDGMSRTIASEILRHFGDPGGRKVLEAGCGRGIISAELARLGAPVYLLDISQEALGIAERHFASQDLRAFLTKGDILDMPFGESEFDLVWNAGVMEHLCGDLQAKALGEIARTLRPGGLFISFNPSAKAIFYSIGKRHAERKGRWPYGPEFPVESLRDKCGQTGLEVLAEYPICFRENLSYLSYASKHLRSVLKLLLSPFPDEFLMRIFGGYLLVTVAERRK